MSEAQTRANGATGAVAVESAPAVRHLLFLIADTGGGHRAAAAAVAREVAVRHPGRFAVHVVDPFSDAAPSLAGRVASLYSPIIRRAPWLWGAIYHVTDSRPAVAALRASALRLVDHGLRDIVRVLDPAAVVSFHPLLNHVTARALQDVAPGTPLVTVVTDLADVHAAWICPDVDAVVTGAPQGVDRCRRWGVPAGRVFDLGHPVDGGFAQPPPTDAERRALRRRLGMREDAFAVLVSGGAEGSGGLYRRVRALAQSRLPVDVLAVCGRNGALLQRLRTLEATPPTRLLAVGFVDDMPDRTRAADLAVTKAGPGTIAETLASGVPLLVVAYLPGQERGNVALVVATGAGRYVPGVRELLDAVAELSAPGSKAYADMREAVRHAARPDAAAAVADLVVGLAVRTPA